MSDPSKNWHVTHLTRKQCWRKKSLKYNVRIFLLKKIILKRQALINGENEKTNHGQSYVALYKLWHWDVIIQYIFNAHKAQTFTLEDMKVCEFPPPLLFF